MPEREQLGIIREDEPSCFDALACPGSRDDFSLLLRVIARQGRRISPERLQLQWICGTYGCCSQHPTGACRWWLGGWGCVSLRVIGPYASPPVPPLTLAPPCERQ